MNRSETNSFNTFHALRCYFIYLFILFFFLRASIGPVKRFECACFWYKQNHFAIHKLWKDIERWNNTKKIYIIYRVCLARYSERFIETGSLSALAFNTFRSEFVCMYHSLIYAWKASHTIFGHGIPNIVFFGSRFGILYAFYPYCPLNFFVLFAAKMCW